MIKLTSDELSALTANYGLGNTNKWQKAERVKTIISLVITYRDAPYIETIPMPLREWLSIHVYSSHPCLGGMRVHAPKRLQALLSTSSEYEVDCLVSNDEVWVIAFKAIHYATFKHDLLTEWQALSRLTPIHIRNPQEEWLYNPSSEHRELGKYAQWTVISIIVIGFGLLLFARAGLSPLGAFPLLVGLAMLLQQLRRDIFPETVHGTLLSIHHKFKRVGPNLDWPIAWYHSGDLLLEQEHLQPSAEDNSVALIYVDTTPGYFRIKIARAGEQLMAWRSRDVFNHWLEAKLDWGLVAIPVSFLLGVGVFHGHLMAGVNPMRNATVFNDLTQTDFDHWVFSYCLTAAAVLLCCWRCWRRSAIAQMEALFERHNGGF